MSRLFSLVVCAALFWACVAADPDPIEPGPRHALVHQQQEPARSGRTLTLPPVDVRSTGFLNSFERLLVSWNVDLEPGAGFEVELRVHAESSGWSPWLFLGEWGTLPEQGLGRRETRFDGGRIATDEFVGSVAFERAQVRFLTTDTVELERVSLCFSSGVSGNASGAQPVAAGFDGVLRSTPSIVLVPRLSQREADPELGARICSPTSLTMVLGAHGVHVAVGDVAARAYDGLHDLYGNWPRSIQTAWSYGVPGYLARLHGLDELERHLAAGRPVVLSIAFEEGELSGAPIDSTRGHLLVVVGFEGGRVIVHDPAAATAAEVRRAYDRDQLERAWQGHGGVAYVLGE